MWSVSGTGVFGCDACVPQLAEQLDLDYEELCASERFPSLMEAARAEDGVFGRRTVRAAQAARTGPGAHVPMPTGWDVSGVPCLRRSSGVAAASSPGAVSWRARAAAPTGTASVPSWARTRRTG